MELTVERLKEILGDALFATLDGIAEAVKEQHHEWTERQVVDEVKRMYNIMNRSVYGGVPTV